MQIRLFRKTITFGYILIAVLIGGIAYTSFYEWRKLETIEEENRHIDKFRFQLHDAHVQMIEFSLLGETILEWDLILWKITIPNVWRWTVCCAVSKCIIHRSV